MQQIHLVERIEDMIGKYQGNRFLVIRQFLSSDGVKELLTSTQYIKENQVMCGDENVKWGEQVFEEGHPIYAFFSSPELVELVLNLTKASQITDIRCWTSIYRVNEYIDPHKDSDGTIQVLVCLQSPTNKASGGSLVLRHKLGAEIVFLQPGDAVIFEAVSIEHYTTPIEATVYDSEPKRIVAVSRYWMRHNNLYLRY